MTVLGPRRDYDDTNNTSIVLRVDFGETSFLFTGDMERDAEADLLSDGCDVSCTVLKVGHHGSSTSTSYPLPARGNAGVRGDLGGRGQLLWPPP